jgi:hypothetical protein
VGAILGGDYAGFVTALPEAGCCAQGVFTAAYSGLLRAIAGSITTHHGFQIAQGLGAYDAEWSGALSTRKRFLFPRNVTHLQLVVLEMINGMVIAKQ